MRELDVFHCPLDGVHLIEASAGTGKTWNLCGLYLRLLLEQQRRVEEILVVTFTKAATAELKERIRSRLAELSRSLEGGEEGGGDPFIGQLLRVVIAGGRVSSEEAKHRLRLALECFDQAAIFTIHGFCQRALAETPFAASQPFQFDFLAEDSLLAHETAADFWRRHVGQGPVDDGLVATLLDKGLGPDWLASHLARRAKKPLSRLIWPDFAASPVADLTSLNQAVTTAKSLWQGSAPAICQAILSNLAELKLTSYKEANVQAAAEAWSRYFTSELGLRPIDDRQKLFALDFLVKGTKKGCRTPSHPFFVLAQSILDLSQAAKDAWAMQQRRLLHDWLAEGPEEFLRRKLDRRLLSYDDLLSRLHHALCSGEFPWLAAELHRRYPCALIDEFQDTDPLQFQIFDQIMTSGRRGPIFLIGDPKQAIYSFRNADLNTYLAARQSADSQATLQANQRSTPGVIRAVNDLFAANPSVFILPNLAYQAVTVGLKPRLALRDGSGEDRADLTLWLLPSDDEGLLLKDEARQAVTVATAAEISRLLAAALDITIGEACLKPADIAVLVRSHRQGSAVKRALTALGIGCVELGQSSVFESGQAEEVERVLRAVSAPGHLPSLKAALATELLGQDAQAIEAVNGDEESLSAWVQVFGRLRELWLEQGFGVFWRALLRQQGAAVTVLSLAGGERKWTNFLHLGELLQAAAAEQPGIDGLLRWLAANRAALESPDDSAQLRLESDENLVSILTVHKAKGLEFPIVFCPFLFDGWSASPGRELEGIEYHQGGQGVIDFSLAETEIAAAKERAKGELAAESARLLYVALTRAVYRCYLVAGCYGIATRGRPSLKESARSTLNWLAAGAGVPFEQWQEGNTPAAAIDAAWQGLATASAGAIGLTALPTSPGVVLAAEAHHGGEFAACQPALHFPPSWRLSSFSALNRLSEHESAIPDHDTTSQTPAHGRGEPPMGLRQDDFLRFPQGPTAGECLHRVLELVDFSQPTSWDEAIRRGLIECPPVSLEGQGPETPALAAMLRTLLADLLSTPLAEGLMLSSLGRDQCLIELEFSFPAERVTSSEVNRLLARLGYDLPKLTFPVLHGFIKGFIDLLFCYQGQYFLLDWKSNHLGFTPADYGPEPLAAAMRQHGYHLQYLLYAVAVHRFLALRLPGYDFNRHFGGVLYLFVRGVRPGWKNADGSPSGVYYHRPSLVGLEQLDHLFCPES